MPWCEHAQALSGELDLARSLVDGARTLEGNGVRFGAVDLSTEHQLGQDNKITVSPTVLMFKPDGTVEEYLGLRESRPITNYCLSVVDEMDVAEANTAPLLPEQATINPDWQRFYEEEINTGDVIVLTDSNFDKVLYNSPDVWIVVFSAEFCKFCKAFAPIYAETSASLAGKVNFGYVDAIGNKALQRRFGIKSVP